MEKPRFCPNRHCPFHRKIRTSWRWFSRCGSYTTRFAGRITRLQCKFCRRKFSRMTFSCNYYAKRKVSYLRVCQELCSTSSIRDISRNLAVSRGTVENRISRLSRQAIGIHWNILQHLRLKEDCAADGFESFTVSQYFPCNIHLLAGSESQMVYFANSVTLRRKGRMTEKQKSRRELLELRWKPPAYGVLSAFLRLLGVLKELSQRNTKGQLVLYTDKHQAYRRAYALRAKTEQWLLHRTVSSRALRTRGNPLFPVNYMDRQLRKDLANHVRETTAFSRNMNHCMERIWVYLFSHNYRKWYREGMPRGTELTHAEVAGVAAETVRQAVRDFLSRRVFLSHLRLPEDMNACWNRSLPSPLAKGHPYLPAFARD